MKFITMHLLLIISVLVAGCASTPPQTPPAANIACIEGGAANFFRYFTQCEAHVAVMPEVNRQAGPYSRHCMPPGDVVLGVSAAHIFARSHQRVLVSLENGHYYQVRANCSNKGGFQVTVVDITRVPEKIAYEFLMEDSPLASEEQTRDLTARVE